MDTQQTPVQKEYDEDQLARAEEVRELLVCLAIATVSAGVGFYLQQRFKWKIPGIN